MGRPSCGLDHGSNRREGGIRWSEGETLLRLDTISVERNKGHSAFLQVCHSFVRVGHRSRSGKVRRLHVLDLHIKTTNPEALKAIHDVLRFQIGDHHTGDTSDISSE